MATLRLKFVPVVACLAFGLAACGDDGGSTTTDAVTTPVNDTVDDIYGRGSDAPDTTEATETSATDATDTSVDDSGGDDTVLLADSALGQILVDFDGYTLYLFANDPPDTVTCTGGCASTWPPVFAPAEVHAGDGLEDDLFTSVDGENGPQLSYNGHPLYYYAGDTSPGDTNGQGVGGVWFVLDAEGNAIT
jgi:predicted lipoprotein with Yx(FWY)xxD motif